MSERIKNVPEIEGFCLPGQRPFLEIGLVGLALLCRPSENGRAETRHVGILFKDPGKDDGIRLIHFADHHQLLEEAATPSKNKSYGWTAFDPRALSQENARLMRVLCQLLGTKYRGASSPRIAYAFRYRGGKFNPISGDFLSEGGHGLTCATFVLSVFASYGIHLLRCEQWPARLEDAEWQAEMFRKLKAKPDVDPRHIQAIEAEIPCARFRPEEVAAAGLAGTLPMGFQDAEQIGLALVQAMFNHGRRR